MTGLFALVVTTLPSTTKGRNFRGLRSIGALILREMSTSYGKSAGGYVWAILEPAVGITLLTFVFSLALHAPPLGTNFQIFYATGYLPFILYREIEVKVTLAIRFSKSLLFYPGVVYTDAIIARVILNSLAQVLVFYVVIITITSYWETRTILDLGSLITCFTMAVILGTGVGCMNCLLIAVFPAWERIWAIVNRPLVFISGVMFLYTDVPEPYKGYLWYNPMVHVVGQMRQSFYSTYNPSHVTPLYVYGIGLTLIVISLFFLNRYHKTLLDD